MKMTVYRYKAYDHQHDDLAYIPSHYATREYIEQLDRTTIIEYDYVEVEESDLDGLGRIEIDK
jgi:hypothetical protein|uniref:hypothetical protein n=1 Tax=Polynucleobacter sp. TaxID=2029855 RepID=UPI004048623B